VGRKIGNRRFGIHSAYYLDTVVSPGCCLDCAAVGAGVVVTATVIAGVHTGLLQKTGMLGPSAVTTSDPSWFGGLEMNPSMFTMGTVV